MKKLMTMVALVGMGAFLAGCGGAEETKAPSKPPANMTGPGAVHSGPKADAGDKKEDGAKDMDKDADKGDAGAADEKKADEASEDKKEGE